MSHSDKMMTDLPTGTSIYPSKGAPKAWAFAFEDPSRCQGEHRCYITDDENADVVLFSLTGMVFSAIVGLKKKPGKRKQLSLKHSQ